MNYKKFSIMIVCVLYGCLVTVALVNIVVDPYGIFQTPFLKRQSQPNERYTKIEFLRARKGRYDSYIMGSSRTAFTSPDIVMRYLPGANFYNLSTIIAAPYEHVLHLKYLVKNGYPVRNLYIGLDIDLCFVVKMYKDEELLVKLHPRVLNRSEIGYYWSYLSVFPRKDIKRKLKLNFRKKAAEVFFEDPASNDSGTIQSKMKGENLEGLRELVALCRQHGINLILFITPHHKFMMNRFPAKDYLAFLRELSQITGFWNFSGYNSITTNDDNYLDRSHYKPSVSRLIAARIFNDKTIPVPEDFGFRVTKENVDSYLEELRTKITENRPQTASQK